MLTVVLGLLRGVSPVVWIVVAALAWGGLQHHRAKTSAEKAAAAQVQAAQQSAGRQAEQQARAQEQRNAEAIQSVAAAYGQRLAQVGTDAAGLRAERQRLRNDLAATPAGCAASDATATAGTDGAARLRIVVDECTGAVETLAGNLEREKSRLIALQEYERERQRLEAQITQPKGP